MNKLLQRVVELLFILAFAWVLLSASGCGNTAKGFGSLVQGGGDFISGIGSDVTIAAENQMK